MLRVVFLVQIMLLWVLLHSCLGYAHIIIIITITTTIKEYLSLETRE